MSNLSELKQELISQKSAIESKGGSVKVLNTNPSPAEITAGIKSITIPDLSLATATENDVLIGKTFYALDNTIRTGTLKAVDESESLLFWAGYDDSTEPYEIVLPSGNTTIRPYFIYNITRPIILTLNEEFEIASKYAFNGTDVTITNFHDMKNLTTLQDYSFSNCKGIDLANLPTSITYLNSYCFANVDSTSSKLVISPNVTYYGGYVYGGTSDKVYFTDLDMSALPLSTTPTGLFENSIFDCDLSFPSTVTTVGIQFNFGGSFNHVTLHENINNVKVYAFYAKPTDPVEIFKMKSFTFLREKPPTLSTQWLALQVLKTGFHIYVPDNSVEAYKSLVEDVYKDYITPISEMAE